MKTTIVQEISEIDESTAIVNGSDMLKSTEEKEMKKEEDYPKNIENYLSLLKALYENSLNHNRTNGESKENNNNNVMLLSEIKACSNNGDANDKIISTNNSVNNDDNDNVLRCKNVICNNDDAAARAAPYINSNNNKNINNHGVTTQVPDDSNINYNQNKDDDENYDDHHDIKRTPCNNNHNEPHTDGANDYHTNGIITAASIDTSPSRRVAHLTGDIKPITSTYLLMTRSMGLTDEDALNLVSRNFFFFPFLIDNAHLWKLEFFSSLYIT